MALLIAGGESSSFPIHFWFIRSFNRFFDSVKNNASHIFPGIFCSHNDINANDRPSTDEQSHTSVGDLFSREKDSGNKKDPLTVFNALDTMLKDSLERLRIMRDSITVAKGSLQGITCIEHYDSRGTIIRKLCLEGKLSAALCLRRKMIGKGALCKEGKLNEACYVQEVMSKIGVKRTKCLTNLLSMGYAGTQKQ